MLCSRGERGERSSPTLPLARTAEPLHCCCVLTYILPIIPNIRKLLVTPLEFSTPFSHSPSLRTSELSFSVPDGSRLEIQLSRSLTNAELNARQLPFYWGKQSKSFLSKSTTSSLGRRRRRS